MFTGLIEEIGTILNLYKDSASQQTILVISAKVVLEGVSLGDSIAVNGVCLTVTSYDANQFTVGLSPETLQRTNLGSLKTNSLVNLERSLTANSKIGGHYVQGHVDATGEIIKSEKNADSLRIVIETSPQVTQYVVEKGYIAVDGTSLTVVAVTDTSIEIMLIQYTQQKVTLAKKSVGERVNLEADIMGKQIVAYLQKYDKAIKAKL
jgi:riboflavin synthase